MDDDYDRLAESLFSISLSLSSVPADFELDAAEKEAKDRLSRYIKRSPLDDTQRVLTSFIEYLPARGKLTVSKFIAASQADDRLFELAEHFSTAIFIPSEYNKFVFALNSYITSANFNVYSACSWGKNTCRDSISPG